MQCNMRLPTIFSLERTANQRNIDIFSPKYLWNNQSSIFFLFGKTIKSSVKSEGNLTLTIT